MAKTLAEMWAFLYCPRERALQISQKVREDVNRRKKRKKIWQTKQTKQ